MIWRKIKLYRGKGEPKWGLAVSHSVVPDALWSHGLSLSTRLLCPWNSSGKNTGMGCHFLPQGIFLTQGSSWPRDRSWVSCIAGRFFAIWASREMGKECPKSQTLNYNINTLWGCNVQRGDYSLILHCIWKLLSE